MTTTLLIHYVAKFNGGGFKISSIQPFKNFIFGGNALDPTDHKNAPFCRQTKHAIKTMGPLLNYIDPGVPLLIGHGNGPQVGALQRKTLLNLNVSSKISQLLIGAQIEDAILLNAKEAGIKDLKVKVIPAEVVVSATDSEFKNPTKPIGKKVSAAEKDSILKKDPSLKFKELADGLWRQVVPSPLPVKNLRLDEIIFYLSRGYTVISTGGGGVPVIDTGIRKYKDLRYEGVEAVIDKDLASANLVISLIEAGIPREAIEKFVIVTDTPNVFINYKKENEEALDKLDVNEILRLVKGHQFVPGSMLPKILACMAIHLQGIKSSIIGLDNLEYPNTGTLITGTLNNPIKGNVLEWLVNFGREQYKK